MRTTVILIRRCVSILLVVLFSFFIPVTAFASNNSSIQNIAGNKYYEMNVCEKVDIDGVEYIFNYYLDKDNNRTVRIMNESTGQNEIVKYCKQENVIYHNDKVLMQIKPSESIEKETMITPFSTWTYLTGPDCSYISWAKGTTVAVVAAALSVYIGSIGGAAVIAAMGTAALSTLASGVSGGTICVTVYYMNLITSMQYKYVWNFTASTGDYYGPYTHITNPSPY